VSTASKTSMPDIKHLFEPRSVAVIGASSHEGKIGYKLIANIKASGYKGRGYPRNPKGGSILGFKAYADILDVKEDVDIAVMVIPAKAVLDEVKKCAQQGRVKFLSIITSGFSEVGNIETERQIKAVANAGGMRVLGPNIFGTYSAKVSLNATFGPLLRKGDKEKLGLLKSLAGKHVLLKEIA